ncbi:MAG: Hpr(Ser) kinase/phosphatase [Myxococcaceae bacterium]|nr:Hpr(Ser) kinase/phosphatase [Myxococcaceae bacterium]
MHAYSVYGLALQSDFPIPEMLTNTAARGSAEPAPDVVVALGKVPADWFPETARPVGGAGAGVPAPPKQALAADGLPPSSLDEEGESWAERRAESNETLCVFDGVGRYLIRGGTHVLVEPDPRADFDVVRHLLLGPVLAQLLWQRDLFTLHASVVGFGDKYAAFVGVSGEGKSTTAAALEVSGHPLVCDDVAALSPSAGGFQVLPGFPRIRLYDDSVTSVGADPAHHPRVHSLIDKRSKSVASFKAQPVELDRLYVLATGSEFAITPLSRREAVMEVLRHTYYAHQYAPLYGFKQHLQKAARVVERVPAFRLTRPKDLARLPELVGLLEAHTAG